MRNLEFPIFFPTKFSQTYCEYSIKVLRAWKCLSRFGWFAQKLYLLVLPWNSTRPGDPSNVLFWFSSLLWCRGFTLFSLRVIMTHYHLPPSDYGTFSLWKLTLVQNSLHILYLNAQTLRMSVTELNATEFESKVGVRLGWIASQQSDIHSKPICHCLDRLVCFVQNVPRSSVLVRNAEVFVGSFCLQRVKMTLRLCLWTMSLPPRK